jgi:MarR family transcriptional regulator, transcriptional regulator for hemolysin
MAAKRSSGASLRTPEAQALPLLQHLSRVASRAIETSAAAGESLRPRHVLALKLLSEHGPLGQQHLAEALRLDPSNVVGLLNELESQDLVTRRRDPEDRRRHIVELSGGGADELALAQARFAVIEDELLSALSPAERDQLSDLLRRAVGVDGTSACLASTDEADVSC